MNKKWDFGLFQPEIKIENGVLSWKGHTLRGSYPVNSIQGIQYESNIVLAYFTVLASGGNNEKVQIPKSEKSRRIIQEVNDYISKHKEVSLPPPPANNGPDLIADELVKLVQLRDMGALTNEEFETQKQKLLNR